MTTVRVVPAKPPRRQAAGGKAPPKAPPRPQNGGGGGGGGHWSTNFTTVSGGIAATVHNAILILQHDPAWAGKLQYDEFAQRVVFVDEPPMDEWAPKSYTPPKERDGDEATSSQLKRYVGREVTDVDCSRGATWIERKYKIKLSALTVHEAMETVARIKSVHPVRKFLSAIVWDGTHRLGQPARAEGTLSPTDPGAVGQTSWLSRYLGAADNDYTRAVGRWWLVSAIARIFIPGCQAQHMMILEGNQGLGKSRALRALFDPWFSEDLPDVTSKDALQQLAGVWGLEVAEMDAINKGGINAAKRFISKAVDRYREPYGRRVRDFPRQLVFCGTTNQTTYLVDTTGNRRYWPVMTHDIDVDLLRQERDQLLAEALLAFQSGEQWWPHVSQIDMLREQQDDRVAQDAWHSPVIQWLNSRRAIDSGVTVAGLLTALDIDKARWGPAEEARASRLLLQMGRIRVRRVYDGYMQYVYDPPPTVQHPYSPAPTPEPQQPEADPGFTQDPEQQDLWGENEDDDWK